MNWATVQMKSFLKERKGRYKPNDIAIKGLKRIEKIDFSGNIHLSEKSSKTDMILIRKGDLVISGINVEKGAMTVYNGDEDVKATIHYSSYEFDSSKIDIEFLTHFLKSSEFVDALKEQVPGGIKTEIKPKHILPLKVTIPIEIKDQKLIVKQLDTSNSKIFSITSELTHQLDLVKQLRHAFLREAMQGKLTESWRNEHPDIEPASQLLKKINAEKEQLIKDKKINKQKPLPPIAPEDIPFEIPDSWEWCRLGEIISLKSGQDLKPSQYSDTIEIGLPYITGASNLENEKVIINRWTNTPKSIAVKGELLLTCKGSGVGKMAWLETSEVHIARQIMAINTFISNLKFVKVILSLNIDNYRLKAKSLIPGIDRDTVLNTLIPLPSLSEQLQIVSKLDNLMQYCDQLEESIKNSQKQNDQLLQQVLREALEPKNKEIIS